MPGVTGSATCPAGGNPSTTAGKQRYRRAFRRCRPEQASDRRSRTLPEPGHAELVPGTGRGGILAAMGWNPKQIVAFCPYIKAPADIMMMGAPNTGREDVHSF
jgi:hypothetical protein